MSELGIKLTRAQQSIMLEATKRYLQHYYDAPIETAMLGLGTAATYECVRKAGLMLPVSSIPKKRESGWWKVTPVGAKIIKEIIKRLALLTFDENEVEKSYSLSNSTKRELINHYNNCVLSSDETSLKDYKYYISCDFHEASEILNCYEIHALFMKNNVIPDGVTWDHEHSCCYYYFRNKKMVNTFIRRVADFVYKQNNTIEDLGE